MLPRCDALINAAAVHKVEHFKVTNSASCQFPKGISHILFMFKATKQKNKILNLNVYLAMSSRFEAFLQTFIKMLHKINKKYTRKISTL